VLDGLDDVDWASLTHAYGPATDVPGQLRALAGPESAAALEALYGNIYHQGTTYPASAAAVPFLFELAPARPEVISLLASMAIGFDEDVLPHGVPPYYAQDPTYAAIATRVATAHDWLSFEPAETARLLAWFPSAAAESLPALWARAEPLPGAAGEAAPPGEGGEAAAPRAGETGACLLAIGLLGSSRDVAQLAPFIADGDATVRACAAIALARLAPGDLPDGALEALLAAARGEVPEEPGIAFLYDDLRGYAAKALQLLGPEHRARAIDAIAHAFEHSDAVTGLALVHGLLPLAFDGPVTGPLSGDQQRAVEAIRSAPWFSDGTGFGNVTLMLRGYGLELKPKRGRRRWWGRSA